MKMILRLCNPKFIICEEAVWRPVSEFCGGEATKMRQFPCRSLMRRDLDSWEGTGSPSWGTYAIGRRQAFVSRKVLRSWREVKDGMLSRTPEVVFGESPGIRRLREGPIRRKQAIPSSHPSPERTREGTGLPTLHGSEFVSPATLIDERRLLLYLFAMQCSVKRVPVSAGI